MPKMSKSAEKLPAFDLLSIREKLDMTQHEMADFLSTSQSSIVRWETEGNAPKLVRDYITLHLKHAKQPKAKKTA